MSLDSSEPVRCSGTRKLGAEWNWYILFAGCANMLEHCVFMKHRLLTVNVSETM
jgi:hypothetical protein